LLFTWQFNLVYSGNQVSTYIDNVFVYYCKENITNDDVDGKECNFKLKKCHLMPILIEHSQ